LVNDRPAGIAVIPATKPTHSARFTFIDGLRGIAAMGVVCCHLMVYGRFAHQFKEFTPTFLYKIVLNGFLGVPVFFVLSGFVIAYSQRGIVITGRFLGNFALRRSLRLDPPYWTTIILMLSLKALMGHVRGEEVIPFPGWPAIAAHIFYLQSLLHVPEINGVFWTLCYEVQFYLVLTILVWICQSLPLANRPLLGFRHGSRLLVFGAIGIISVAAHLKWIPVPQGLFIDRWYSFFIGVLIWWILDRSVSAKWLWAYMAIMLGAVMLDARHGDAGVWLTTFMTPVGGGAIFLVAWLGKLETLLRGRVIQFLGRISYSLYLIHIPIGGLVDSVGVRYYHGSPLLVYLWIALSIAGSITFAYVMYRFVERPGVEFGKRFKYRPRPSQAGALSGVSV
jgi:peptidoglycan/LPS O-acetylase OafA/YrhL